MSTKRQDETMPQLAPETAPAEQEPQSAPEGKSAGEPGKDADIAVFNGDPFSNLTLCEATMIDGSWEFKRGMA